MTANSALHLDFFKKADKTIRRFAYNFGEAKWPADLEASSIATSFPFDVEGRTSHARLIQQSLKPFTVLNSKVKVIYLPLFLEQKWAPEIIKEIILISMIAHVKNADLATNFGPDTLKDILSEAETRTNEIVQKLPRVTKDHLLETDQAIISSLLKFAQLYAQATGAPFFFNASWTCKEKRTRNLDRI